MEYYNYPAEHWVHLRTTNQIESTFATVRLRQKVTKGPGSRAAGIAMAFKLIESAQNRWRAVNALHLVALVRAGDTFKACPQERPPPLTGRITWLALQEDRRHEHHAHHDKCQPQLTRGSVERQPTDRQ